MIRGFEFSPSNVESNSIIVHHFDGNHAFPEGILTEAIEYWYSSLYFIRMKLQAEASLVQRSFANYFQVSKYF